MKKRTLHLLLFVFVVIISACKEYEFNNPVDPDVPINAPTNLKINNFTENKVILTWQDNSNYEIGFDLEQSEDGANFTLIKSTDPNEITATIFGSYYNIKTYSFRIRAKTKYKFSGFSNVVSSKIQYNVEAPSNLQIDEISSTKIKLSWKDNSNIESGFEIFLSEDGNNYNLVKSVNLNVINTEITGVFNFEKSYYFKVRAKTNINFSEFSNIVQYGIGGLIEMVTVQGGTFLMGSGKNDAQPIHSVTLNTFRISKFEVTQKLWKAIMGTNPSHFLGDDNRPVDCVSWDMVQQFIVKLNQLTGKNYRLPTEAEWEYASRGGSQRQGYAYSGSNDINAVAWYSSNSGITTHPVGTKAPNELGIFDMSGNVCEWCYDWYNVLYYGVSQSTNPTGPSTGYNRVLRGGYFYTNIEFCSTTHRDCLDPGSFAYYPGARLALSP